MFWWVWRLFGDDGDGVDAKDICPSPNKSCLDDFEFVGRVGFNRGGDAVSTLCVLGRFPCPPSTPQVQRTIKLGGGSVEDRQGGYRRPSRTCGTRLCHRKLDFGGAVSAVRSVRSRSLRVRRFAGHGTF